MISITRLLELRKDLDILRAYRYIPRPAELNLHPDTTARLGEYIDILEDYLRIQQGSA